MRGQLEQRLKQLKAEYEAGQKMLAELEAKQASVRETPLRISGATQVLEEELAKADAGSGGAASPDRTIRGRLTVDSSRRSRPTARRKTGCETAPSGHPL
jgi:hypothetical protein